jgi:hypothetical protein
MKSIEMKSAAAGGEFLFGRAKLISPAGGKP